MTGTVYGIGVGPGDAELMTLKGARLLGACPVVAYPAPPDGDSLARRIAAPHIPAGRQEYAIRMPLDAARFPAEDVYAEAAAVLREYADAGHDVAVLCEGDPFFYGSFMYLFARLAETCVVEVVPGVSSLTACAAVLQAPLAARSDVLSVVPATLEADVLKAKLGAVDAAAIIKLGRHFAKVRGVLDELGLIDKARYVERATMATQRVVALPDVDDDAVPYFATILVHRRQAAWS